MKSLKITAIISAVLIISAGCSSATKSDNASSANSSTALQESSSTVSLPDSLPADTEQALKLVSRYSRLYNKLFPINDINKDIVDTSQSITADRTINGNMTTLTFYKVIKDAPTAKDEFESELDEMLTPEMKSEFLADSERHFEYKDDNLYVASRGAGGIGTGMDKLILDSAKQDGDKLTINVTSFGSKENWGTDNDIKDSTEITLEKTADGLRIGKCDINAVTYFSFYDSITYGYKRFPELTANMQISEPPVRHITCQTALFCLYAFKCVAFASFVGDSHIGFVIIEFFIKP